MEIYIDNDFKCHTTAAENRREIETDVFEGKCSAYIKGYRFVPAGETWVRNDGEVFKGETLSPWRDLTLLEEFQAQYEAQIAAADAAYQEGVNTAYD